MIDRTFPSISRFYDLYQWRDDQSSQQDSGSGAAYQVFAGVEMAVTEDVSLTLEARHQAAFDEIEIGEGSTNPVEYRPNMVLAGILFSF